MENVEKGVRLSHISHSTATTGDAKKYMYLFMKRHTSLCIEIGFMQFSKIPYPCASGAYPPEKTPFQHWGKFPSKQRKKVPSEPVQKVLAVCICALFAEKYTNLGMFPRTILCIIRDGTKK